MKANELQINNFLQARNVQFVIPVYQRNYDWTNTECKDLLNDIISVETEDRGTHFIGSIVFVHEGTIKSSTIWLAAATVIMGILAILEIIQLICAN